MRSAFRPCLAAAAAGLGAATVLSQRQQPVYCASPEKPKSKQEVFMWGRKEALPGGSGTDDDLRTPLVSRFFDENQLGWRTVAFGPHFGVALAANGEVYMWGSCLQTAKERYQKKPPTYVQPFKLQGLEGLKVADLKCSREKIYALTEDGRVFVFDCANDVLLQQLGGAVTAAAAPGGAAPSAPAAPAAGVRPHQVAGLPVASTWTLHYNRVVQISAGDAFACFLTANGEVYCSGDNSYGQCGKQPEEDEGQEVDNYVPLHKVTFPEPHIKIASVTCGGRHVIALDTAGNAYAWGDDHKIQLNLGDTRTTSSALVGSTWKDQLEKGYVGKNTALAAYGFYNRHLQHQPIKTLHPPQNDRPVPYPPASKAVCGEDFSIFVHRDSPDWWEKSRESNALMCCGENMHGQCGRTLNKQQQTQMPVRLPRYQFTELLACGSGHCLAALRTGVLYGWGWNKHGQVGAGPRGPTMPCKVWLDGKPVREELNPETVVIPGKPQPPPQPVVEQKPESPGKIVYLNCGFDNSVVIREIPVAP